MCPAAVAPVAVTFTTTADTPLAGTPPRPVTCTATAACALTGALGAPTPLRVSSNRDGATGTNAPAADGVPAALAAAPERPTWPVGAPEADPAGTTRANANSAMAISKTGRNERIRRYAGIIPPPGFPPAATWILISRATDSRP